MKDDDIARIAKDFLLDKAKIKADKASYSIKFVVPGITRKEKKFFDRLYQYISYTAKFKTEKLIYNMDFPGETYDVTMLEIRYNDRDECDVGWARWEQYKKMVFGESQTS